MSSQDPFLLAQWKTYCVRMFCSLTLCKLINESHTMRTAPCCEEFNDHKTTMRNCKVCSICSWSFKKMALIQCTSQKSQLKVTLDSHCIHRKVACLWCPQTFYPLSSHIRAYKHAHNPQDNCEACSQCSRHLKSMLTIL